MRARLQRSLFEGGFLGPIISDIRDNDIDNCRFPTIWKGHFRFIYNFCVRIRWNVHCISVFRHENRAISDFRHIRTPLIRWVTPRMKNRSMKNVAGETVIRDKIDGITVLCMCVVYGVYKFQELYLIFI